MIARQSLRHCGCWLSCLNFLFLNDRCEARPPFPSVTPVTMETPLPSSAIHHVSLLCGRSPAHVHSKHQKCACRCGRCFSHCRVEERTFLLAHQSRSGPPTRHSVEAQHAILTPTHSDTFTHTHTCVRTRDSGTQSESERCRWRRAGAARVANNNEKWFTARIMALCAACARWLRTLAAPV